MGEPADNLRIGPYRLLAALGEGGMARLYLARHPERAEAVAIKQVLPVHREEREFLTMLLDEGQLLRQLRHRNVLQVHDVGQDPKGHYLVMEYVAGETIGALDRRLRKAGEPFPERLAAELCAQAARGLAHAHSALDGQGRPLGIVHRDVSPANVMLTDDGVVKVLDFGIARAAGRLTRTRAGMVKGKFSYMSPEQATGRELDGRADVFSLGVVLHELLSGRRLHTSVEPAHVIRLLSGAQPIPSILDATPDRDPELVRICERALALKPERRTASAAHLARDLEGWLATHGPVQREELAGLMQQHFPGQIAQRAQVLAGHGVVLPPPERDDEPPTELHVEPLAPSPTGKTPRHASAEPEATPRDLSWLPAVLLLVTFAAGVAWWLGGR